MEDYKSKIGTGNLALALGKLYTDPFVIYREYIQNACDGIELALRQGLINQHEAVISIQIDKSEISIKDRGIGVSAFDIGPRLVDVGNSTKWKDGLIGQYGIGRLIAAQYCQKIIFETSFPGQNLKSILTWDTEKAFELIDSHEYDDATAIIDSVTHIDRQEASLEEHYFRVRLCGIKPHVDHLIDVQAVREYVSLIAPVDYSMEFKEGYVRPALANNPEYEQLYEKERLYKVVINGEDVRKPYSIDVPGKDANLIQPIFMKFEDPDDGLLGWGWCALNDRIIQMNSVPFRGIRFRKLNMAVGDANVMANYMKNVSVNYFVGEVFLVNEKIQPTGSRDGFVDSAQKSEFDILMKDKAEFLYSLYDRASHMGSQAVDKLTAAYLKKSELTARLNSTTDASDKKDIRARIHEQDKIIETKAGELIDRKSTLQETDEGRMIADAVIQTRQSNLEKKIEDNNSKKNKPKIRKTTIEKLVEKHSSDEKTKEEEPTPEPQDPKMVLLSKLSREQRTVYQKTCDVIDNEPTLTPSYIEALKMKILKRIAK